MVKLAMAATVALALGLTPALHPGSKERAGSLSGRVTFSGAVPAAQPLDLSSEPYCRDAHAGAQPVKQSVRVGAQNGLGDVIVQVKGVAVAPSADQPVTLDQVKCRYQPAVLAVRTGQTLVVRNSDPVLHNVHAFAKRNQPFNIGQPIAGMQSRRTFRQPEQGIVVRCDIHGWMEASITVFDHPHFAVTAEDGTFEIGGLPPGDYEVEAWHPVLGVKTQRVRIGDGVARIEFAFE